VPVEMPVNLPVRPASAPRPAGQRVVSMLEYIHRRSST
jgi:hypothetical protein